MSDQESHITPNAEDEFAILEARLGEVAFYESETAQLSETIDGLKDHMSQLEKRRHNSTMLSDVLLSIYRIHKTNRTVKNLRATRDVSTMLLEATITVNKAYEGLID